MGDRYGPKSIVGNIPRVAVSNNLNVNVLVHGRLENGSNETLVHPASKLTHPVST